MDWREMAIQLILMVLPMLLAVTFHELSHGLVAYRLGDPTAKEAGRLTLNPFRHLDLFGTLAFLITQRIGWAKPVPVNPFHLRNPRRDMMWIAMAGPFANLLLALICGILAGWVGAIDLDPQGTILMAILEPLYRMLKIGVVLNCGLAVFNALPVPPLDGGSILLGLLPRGMARTFSRFEPYGFLVLMILLFIPAVNSAVLGGIVYPIVEFLSRLFMGDMDLLARRFHSPLG